MDSTVQVRQRGTFTLPADLREKYGIRPGDTYRVVDLDGIFVLTPLFDQLGNENHLADDSPWLQVDLLRQQE